MLKKVDTSKKLLVVIVAQILILSMTVGGTLAYLLDQSGTAVNTFTGGGVSYGSLKISKSIDHEYGEDYVIPDDLEFSFEVNMGKDLAGRNFSGYKVDDEGCIDLKVKVGEPVSLEKIPTGTQITVTEKDLPKGFSLKGENNRKVKIQKAKASELDFVNEYRALGLKLNNIKVVGKKILEGREWTDSSKYTMILEKYDGEKWEELKRVDTTKDNKGFDFSEVIQSQKFTKEGTYEFRVREAQGDEEGITYDDNINYFDIEIDDEDMDGEFELAGVSSVSKNVRANREKGAGEVDVSIINSYAPAGSDAVEINIKKTLDDKSGQNKLPKGYKFGLYDEKGDLIGDLVSTSASGEANIKKVLGPEDIGEHIWTLKEINEGDKGVSYDDKKYSLKVLVEDDTKGGVVASIFDASLKEKPKTASKTYSASFKNAYAPKACKVDVAGKKSLEGRVLHKGEFKFELYKTDADYSYSKLSPVSVVSNDEEGNLDIDLSYSKVGTYYYALVEKDNGIKGVAYDDSVYHIKVVVKDVDGELKAESTILDESGKEAEISFENRYSPVETSLIISGTKKLKGAELRAELFEFKLRECDESFENVKGKTYTSSNTKSGKINFAELKYNEEGNHYYLIYEDSKDKIEDVVYDKNKYGVSVRVRDEGTGKYVAKITSIVKLGYGETDEIVFNNRYVGDDGIELGGSGMGEGGAEVKTGDNTLLSLYVALLFVSALGLTLTIIWYLRTRKREGV